MFQKTNKILIFIPKVKPGKILSSAKNKLHMWMETKKKMFENLSQNLKIECKKNSLLHDKYSPK